ncbi:alpha/beta-hydrolase [Lindgomyces ingoldianus]|uniref:Alpha/beta-hydrolase n=1 Tax=Lindgomyces ingoldianus TaxID=673940 RepID=A0ACB6RB36_9PLEO|nr:alpha/beta-hydrolase [Lindgomyces ingoldianus]KAF2475686.1 alpha/beta-hydrolase [Lindgomyces ingoldianus]
MANPPTIVFIPGSFCPPFFYDDSIQKPIVSRGYEMHVLQYPSIGYKPNSLPTMADDAAFISAEVAKVADEGKDIVLVAHSYGGIPASESVKGLSKADRKKAGKKGGVVRLAYMTALVPLVGGNAVGLLADVPNEPEYIKDGWMYHVDFNTSAELIFSDLPLEQGIALAKSFLKHSSASFVGELTYPGYKDAPVSYLFCEGDKCVPPAVQQAMIDMVEKESCNKVDVTRINADHVPNQSAPARVVDWIIKCVEKSK